MRELGRDLNRAQHLSDEAIAAFADDVLTGSARQRARRHTADCPECNHAVAVQREAVWALRAAPAPPLPTGLLDRLREVPVTTPVRQIPTHVDQNGTAMFASFAAPAAAFVPAQISSGRRGRTVGFAIASIAVFGALAGTAAADSGPTESAHAPTHASYLRAELPNHR